jgi:hypothetical protein
METTKVIGGVVSLILGAYLVNDKFSWVAMPSAIAGIQEWLLVVSGAMLIVAGIYFLMTQQDSFGSGLGGLGGF